MIDMGSSMNVVSKDVVELLNLKVEPHPKPFRVAWVDDHTLCLALVAKEVSFDSSISDVPLPPHMRVFEPAENFSKHIHDLHAEIRRKIFLSNEEYKLTVDVHHRYKEFNVGEYVMVRIRPERIPKTFSKILYARDMGLPLFYHS